MVCLYPPHRKRGIKHRLKDCKDFPEDEKPTLLKAYVEERRQKKAQRVQNEEEKRDDGEYDSAIVFKTVFGHRYHGEACVDNGADNNIIDQRTLQSIREAGVDVEVVDLNRLREFEMAACDVKGNKTKLVFLKQDRLDTELHIRHGSSLLLRNLVWLVTERYVTTPLLGRPILEALGINTRELLAAAADRFSGSVDADQMLATLDERGDGRVSRLMEGVFHSEGGEHEEDDGATPVWCDIGGETESEWENELLEKVREAKDKGLSSDGCNTLEAMLRNHRNVVRIRYNGGLLRACAL